MGKNSGYLVEYKNRDGETCTGRTFHHRGLINGKVPVFNNNDKEPPRLVARDQIKVVGFLD